MKNSKKSATRRVNRFTSIPGTTGNKKKDEKRLAKWRESLKKSGIQVPAEVEEVYRRKAGLTPVYKIGRHPLAKGVNQLVVD